MTRTADRVVIALGGNALIRAGQAGTYDEQLDNASAMAKDICLLVNDGHRVMIVHGNGPQAGNLAMQQETAPPSAPPQPLHNLVAMTQGQTGSVLTTALSEVLPVDEFEVATVVTHVVVDLEDPAFERPTKPIGPYLDDSMERAARDRGWTVKDDAGRGRRRMVPSPRPLSIRESRAIATLYDAGFIVIAGGGGGIPVINVGKRFVPIDAVIDKDRTAVGLADVAGANILALVTGVDQLYLDFGKPTARPVAAMSVAEARRHIADDQFAEGSMKPKVESAVAFVENGGEMAIITSPGSVAAALRGETGTRIGRHTP